jgi:alkylation response protein AidB-like acyl-CoA dehydrogenase
MKRSIFDYEHEQLRESFRAFIQRNIVPNYHQWECAGIVPREVFAEAGKAGFLGMEIPERYGGAGVDDFRFNVVLGEEICNAGVLGAGIGITLHNDVCLPYFMKYANDDQRERWLPGIASGKLITAIAMTEPDTGSDLAAISTRAERNGDIYRINGVKTFITNGLNADLIITAVRTGDGSNPRDGLSLVVVERGSEGFERGRNLEKLGMHAQDTSELFFGDARVPVTNLLGREGEGFRYLTSNLPRERLSIAVTGVSAARAAVDLTLEYVKERRAFGKPIGTFQNTRFALAQAHTEVEIAQAFLDQCIVRLLAGDLGPEEAAMAKLWCTEVQGRVVDQCLQLHGGHGYMVESPIARAFADARVTRIYGGTSEIMREIIGRSLGL